VRATVRVLIHKQKVVVCGLSISTEIGDLMTLNGVMAVILHYFTELCTFEAIYVEVVKFRQYTVCNNVTPKI